MKARYFWYRIEYQQRGSPHIHGFLWIEDDKIPDFTLISKYFSDMKETEYEL